VFSWLKPKCQRIEKLMIDSLDSLKALQNSLKHSYLAKLYHKFGISKLGRRFGLVKMYLKMNSSSQFPFMICVDNLTCKIVEFQQLNFTLGLLLVASGTMIQKQ